MSQIQFYYVTSYIILSILNLSFSDITSIHIYCKQSDNNIYHNYGYSLFHRGPPFQHDKSDRPCPRRPSERAKPTHRVNIVWSDAIRKVTTNNRYTNLLYGLEIGTAHLHQRLKFRPVFNLRMGFLVLADEVAVTGELLAASMDDMRKIPCDAVRDVGAE